jgi:hypothetical protein
MASLFEVTAGAAIGYVSGGAVTQATNKGTGVTLNTASGRITAGAYTVQTTAVAAGSFGISVKNVSGGSLSQAIVLNFAVIKAAAA